MRRTQQVLNKRGSRLCAFRGLSVSAGAQKLLSETLRPSPAPSPQPPAVQSPQKGGLWAWGPFTALVPRENS